MSSISIETIEEEPEEITSSETLASTNQPPKEDAKGNVAVCFECGIGKHSPIPVNATMSEGHAKAPVATVVGNFATQQHESMPEGTTATMEGQVSELPTTSAFVNRCSSYLTGDTCKNCEVCKFVSTIGPEIFNTHAQEPWPKDVKLYQPYEVEQILLPDNANCLAVQTFLKMCNLEYTVEPRANAEAMSPTTKVPFIKCGAFIVAELEGIVQFAGSKGISLTQDVSAENKSDMRAYMSLVNNVLGNSELYICWCDAETYVEVTKPRYGSIFPWPLNHIQTWSKRADEIKRLKVLDWYHKTIEEVYNDVENCCQALTDRLDGNDYFFGSKCTELDALVFAHLYLILTIPLPAHLGMVVKKFEKLMEFCRRIDSRVFGNQSDLSPRAFKKKHNKRVVFNEKCNTPSRAKRDAKDVTEVELKKIMYTEPNLSVNI